MTTTTGLSEKATISADVQAERVRTRIWLEEPEPDNRFAARAAWCHGYDVYGEMVGRARWSEMIYLLFRGEAPSAAEAALLDALAVGLANAGPRDPAVHAAMCGAVGGSTAASCLMAALAVGAGHLGGAREVLLAMRTWQCCGMDLDAWQRQLAEPEPQLASVWPAAEHPSGFDPHGVSRTTIVSQVLARLAAAGAGPRLGWLIANAAPLERAARRPISMSGIAAAALADLGFTPEQGEMLYLLLRLPGAAAHALEQAEFGHKTFPFFGIELVDDPAGRGP